MKNRLALFALLLVAANAHSDAVHSDIPWGVAFDYTICLPDYAEPKDFQATVTFAAGDVQISQDGGSFINITALPTHVEAGCWDQNVSAAEMQGDRVDIYYVDTATKVFIDSHIAINTIGAKPFVYRDVAEAAGTSTTTELPVGASTVDDTYNDLLMSVIAGTGVGQSVPITDYVGSTTRQLIHGTLLTSTSTDSVIAIELDPRTKVNCSAGICQSNVMQGESTDWSDALDARIDARLAAYATNGVAIQTDLTSVKGKTDSLTFTVANQVDGNTLALNGNATSAQQLALSAATIENGAAEGTPSTTIIQTDLAETQNDIYIGRVIIWTSGAAQGEATNITDYVGGSGTLTVTALANAPSAGDTFVLL